MFRGEEAARASERASVYDWVLVQLVPIVEYVNKLEVESQYLINLGVL